MEGVEGTREGRLGIPLERLIVASCKYTTHCEVSAVESDLPRRIGFGGRQIHGLTAARHPISDVRHQVPDEESRTSNVLVHLQCVSDARDARDPGEAPDKRAHRPRNEVQDGMHGRTRTAPHTVSTEPTSLE